MAAPGEAMPMAAPLLGEMSAARLKSRGGGALRAETIAEGVTHISLSSRLSRAFGMVVDCFLVDDILVDTGFSHVGLLLQRFLRGRTLRAIACTHHHEDHAGSCAALARGHGCPVYLSRPELRWSEGVEPRSDAAVVETQPRVERPMPLYRRTWWGRPEAYQAEAMPEELESARRLLRIVPTPGHSQTHAVLLDTQSGLLLAGDLLISRGVSAVMAHESPDELVASLRRAADLAPRRLINAHGLTIDEPVAALRLKADRIERAADEVRRLHSQGLPESVIVRRIFAGQGWGRELAFRVLTGGEYSRLCFVRACVAA